MSCEHFVPKYEPETSLLEAHRRQNVQNDLKVLPSDWPKSIRSSMAWAAEDLEDHHITQLSELELREIAGWGREYSGATDTIDTVNKESTVLPLLQEKLARIRQSLQSGLGLAVLRGLDPATFSVKENLLIFAGLSSYIGLNRAKQSGGKIVVHITDLADLSGGSLPAPYRNSNLPFHTDPAADVVAMYVLEPAAAGGGGTFSSVATVYNSLAASDPDLLRELGQPNWPFDRPPDGKSNFYRRPIMFFGSSGEPEIMFSRGGLIKSPYNFRSDDIPNLTMIQSIALDALHSAATSTACTIKYQKGDVVFFNNRRILHGREEFCDARHKRHILRLFLQDEELFGPPPQPLIKVWERALDNDVTSKFNPCEDREMLKWPRVPDLR